MGSASTRHHVNWHRAQLGWFGDVQTVTTSGSYTLAAAELTGTPRLLRVSRGDGTYLNLEYRRPWGTFDNFASTDPVVNGVSIRIAPGTSSLVQSKLVDATPSTTSFSDAALAAGRTVVDPLTGVSITTVSVGVATALVSISYAPDSQPPNGPSSLSATSPNATSVQLGWPAATDNVSVAGYRVYRGTAQIATTTALSYLDSALTPATTYTYGVEAFDAAGNTGARVSASVTTQASSGDTSPPTTPANLAASLQKGRRVALTWSPSSDNVAVVAYDVFRNGSLVASSAGPSYTDRPGRGTFTYYVRARDAAGNVSGNSASVTVSQSDD
jgi:chitodextrinase